LIFHLLELEYIFSNSTQYLIDYPSNSDDNYSNWLFDDEAVEATGPDDHVMNPDVVLGESDSQSFNLPLMAMCTRIMVDIVFTL
jgi:hypothetical protein